LPSLFAAWPYCQRLLVQIVCWYRFDEEFITNTCIVAVASSNNAGLNWYLDSSATGHITRELDKLMMHDLPVANVAGMDIIHVDKSVLSTPTCPLHLNHVLHLPCAHKHLISIHHFNLDNNNFIELHPFFFLIKDQVTRKMLLRRPCRGGLYPLPQLPSPT
jgi:hypothetical protein